MKPAVCFFVNTHDKDLINRNEFYKIDIKILQELGFEVKICNSYRQIPSDVNFYFVWWWTYAIFPVLKAKKLGLKSMITGTFNLAHHVPGADYYSRPLYQKFLIKLSARLTDMNIMVSEFELTKMKKEISTKNVSYSPHVLDIPKYHASEPAEREKNVLTIAWMSDKNARRKCIPEIIQSASILKKMGKKISFILAGKIEQDALYLKNLVHDLGVSDKIKFIGPVDEAAKLNLLRKCGIYLQPTLFEGFGVAIAEALLSEVPVITSNSGAVNEVTNSKCVYVDGRNPKEIATQIIKIFENYDKYCQIASEGSAFIKQNYYLDRRKNDIEQILIQLEIL